MRSLHEIYDPYNYKDTRGKPVVTRVGKPEGGRLENSHYKSICSIKDKDGNNKVAIGGKGEIKIIDLTGGNVIRIIQTPYETPVNSLCDLGNGRIASGSDDTMVRVWDVNSGMSLKVLKGHTRKVISLCALGDGRIVSGSSDTTLRVWDTVGATSREGSHLRSSVCLRVLEGHTSIVTSVCALGEPEAQRIVSGSGDQTLRVWDTKSGKALYKFDSHRDDVDSVCSLGNGRFASVSSYDKTVRVWDLKKQDVWGKLLKIIFNSVAPHLLAPLDENRFICLNDYLRVDTIKEDTDVLLFDITDVDNFQPAAPPSFPSKVNRNLERYAHQVRRQPAAKLIPFNDGGWEERRREREEREAGRGGRRSRKNRSVKGKSRKFKNKKRR